MSWLFLVCIKCKHLEFMSKKPSASSLCFRLGIYVHSPFFPSGLSWNFRSSQLENKYNGATFYIMTSCLHCFSLKSWVSDVKIISSSPLFVFFFPSPSTILFWWSSIVFIVELQLFGDTCTRLLTWQWENTPYD